MSLQFLAVALSYLAGVRTASGLAPFGTSAPKIRSFSLHGHVRTATGRYIVPGSRPASVLRMADDDDEPIVEEEEWSEDTDTEDISAEAISFPSGKRQTEYEKRMAEHGSWILPGTSMYDSINSEEMLGRLVDEPGEGPDEEPWEGSETAGEEANPKQVTKPPPPSPKGGASYVALYDDADALARSADAVAPEDLTYLRTRTSWMHVMWAREPTLDPDAGCEVMWDHAILSDDLRTEVGNVVCIDAKTVEDARAFAEEEPLSVYLSGGNNRGPEGTKLYRWGRVRDYDLRADDGRNGFPTMAFCWDKKKGVEGLRPATRKAHLEYLIDSERIIAAGPLFETTGDGADGGPVGSLVLFNSKSAEDAANFCANDPYALAGLFDDVRISYHNTVDVSGKFFTPDKFAVDPSDTDEVTRYMTSDVQEEGEDGVWDRLLGDKEDIVAEVKGCSDDEERAELEAILAEYDKPWTRIMRPFQRIARKKYDLAETPYVNR